MEVYSVNCECCGLREDCTQQYISQVKSNFAEKWLCGLCSETVRDNEKKNGGNKGCDGAEDAVKAHRAFCSKVKSNPAVRVADGMKQMLRKRRSSDLLAAPKAASI